MISGERIKNIRKMRGLTQKELGQAAGFDFAAADVRIAQYESDNRTPKANLLNAMAVKLEVSPYALAEPQIETELSLLHTLFAIEDLYGLELKEVDGEYGLFLSIDNAKFKKALSRWAEKKERLDEMEIDDDEYNLFRYSYTEVSDEASKQKTKAERKPRKRATPPPKQEEYWLL